MKKQVQWPRRAWVRALAWILGLAACFACVVSGAEILYAVWKGYYEDTVHSYYETAACRDSLDRGYVRAAVEWLASCRSAKEEGTVPPTYSEFLDDGDPNPSFQFVVTDAKTGRQLASNRDGAEAEYVGQVCYIPGDEDAAGQDGSSFWVKSAAGLLISKRQLQNDTEKSEQICLMDCYLLSPAELEASPSAYAKALTQGLLLYQYRYGMIGVLGGSFLTGLVCFILLLCGTGRRLGEEQVRLCWYDRIPMEFSLLGTVLADWLLAMLCLIFTSRIMGQRYDGWENPVLPAVSAGCFVLPAAALTVAWALSFARWAKTGHAFQNFLGIRLLGFIGRGCKKLPVAPKTALIVGAIAVSNLFAYLIFYNEGYYSSRALLSMLLFGGVTWAAVWTLCIYIAANLRTLQNAGRRMAAGDYVTPVDTRGMLPVFCDYAATLGNIRAGVNTAVEQRMRSERLKTELITNVSHDLKTPLTSIINYTDLLQREPLPPRAAEYAAVLARQGEKLKKLTEDLVEASKASAGAMPCHPAAVNLQELAEQALGEYEEKLEAAALTPVVSMPADGLYALADGRLTWRVLDNLLNNACKYALPGTRLYLDGTVQEHLAVLSVKNISRQPLNVSAEELMERFVRGDAARSSEGSGLGLSIARSLTELQGGRFRLVVDGDLFKAELALPLTLPPQAQSGPEAAGPAPAPGAVSAAAAPAADGPSARPNAPAAPEQAT